MLDGFFFHGHKKWIECRFMSPECDWQSAPCNPNNGVPVHGVEAARARTCARYAPPPRALEKQGFRLRFRV
jgi:hypothetical protein